MTTASFGHSGQVSLVPVALGVRPAIGDGEVYVPIAPYDVAGTGVVFDAVTGVDEPFEEFVFEAFAEKRPIRLPHSLRLVGRRQRPLRIGFRGELGPPFLDRLHLVGVPSGFVWEYVSVA